MNRKYITTLNMIFLLGLSSCSGHPFQSEKKEVPLMRYPSSLNIDEDFQKNFELITTSGKNRESFIHDLEQLKSVYLRAESGLDDFDKELDHSISTKHLFTFNNSKSYKRMVAMWNMNHHIQNKLISHYTLLKKIADDQNRESDKKEMALKVLSDIDQKLNSTDPLDILAFGELKSSLGTLNTIHANSQVASKKMSATGLSFFKNNFKQLGKKLERENDDINQEIDIEADKLQFVDSIGREPQQVNEYEIYPSGDTHGVITGNSFPANTWALTYDDGPSAEFTPLIIKNLDELGIKATFFWRADNILDNPNIVKLVKDHGMPRENHSYTHFNLTSQKRTDAILNREIIESTKVDINAYGEKPAFFRCPYGNSDKIVRQMIADLKMIHVYWNVDTLDWQDLDPDSIVARAKKQMKAQGHGIVLFHDVHPQSVIASKKLIEWSQTFKGTENEMRWVTIPQVVNELNSKIK